MCRYWSVVVLLTLGVFVATSVAEADQITVGADKNALFGTLVSSGTTYDVGWRPSSLLCFTCYDVGYYRIYNNVYQFDISGISGGAIINSATLRLYCDTVSSSDDTENVTVHRVLPSGTGQVSDWAEPTATGFSSANPPTGVTGLYRDYPNSQTWDAQYGDYGPALDTVAVDNDTGGVGWYEWDVTAAVQHWMTNGENYGLELVSDSTLDSTGVYRTFVGRTGTAANQPQLVVDFTPIPEPGTMLLIGTGVLGLVGYVRRRRMN